MLTITRRFEFEAAHFLPNHRGKCRYLHGHSYKLEVTISGEICDDKNSERYGMILDFKELNDIVMKIVGHNDKDIDKGLDHNLLNNVFEYPTAENMVEAIAAGIDGAIIFYRQTYGIEREIQLQEVKLWETSDSYASWVRDKKC